MMKNRIYIIIYIGIIFVILLLPNLIIRQVNLNNQNNTNEQENQVNVNQTDVLVNVFFNKQNENVEMNLEEYIKGVISAEMPASYEMEALKAQAVVARTYTLNKINVNKQFGNPTHPNSDICTDINDCQAYITKQDRIDKWNSSNQDSNMLWDKIEQAVNDTKNIIITYNNEPIKAFFHANSGGVTENVELVWSGTPIDYLKSVETAGENNYTQYSSEVLYSFDEFKELVKQRYTDFEIDFNNSSCIQILERSDSNRILKIKIGNIEMSGVDARTLFKLKSTNFEVSIDNGNIKFSVLGYGHGVGMSQTGANELAKQGKNYKEIINHYYTNIEIKNINDISSN